MLEAHVAASAGVSVNCVSPITKASSDIVFGGDTVIDENNINRYPTAINLGYLVDRFENLDVLGALYSFASGTVPMPTTQVVKGAVSDGGTVASFDGPGFVDVENNSIVVHEPDAIQIGCAQCDAGGAGGAYCLWRQCGAGHDSGVGHLPFR